MYAFLSLSLSAWPGLAPTSRQTTTKNVNIIMEDSKDKESEGNIKNLPFLHRFESGRRSEKEELETVLPRLTVLDVRKSKLMNLRKSGYKYDRTYKDDPQATLPTSMQEPGAVVNGRLKKVKDFRSDD